jgi:hypothetical protein
MSGERRGDNIGGMSPPVMLSERFREGLAYEITAEMLDLQLLGCDF